MYRFSMEQFRALIAVIDEGSFEAAADVLRITSPAVSQRIKAMEQVAGRVLVRRSRPVSPTEAGAVVLRLARQVALAEDEAAAALGGVDAWPEIRVAVNADSLGTWAMPALIAATKKVPMALEILREDESNSAEMLRDGTAMAAITSMAHPVQGCSVTGLGDAVYSPVASPDFLSRWLSGGASTVNISRAPIARFDRKDTTFDGLPALSGDSKPPTVYIPDTREFVEAIAAGMAWGFVDGVQANAALSAGRVALVPGIEAVRVPLYWQQWRLESEALGAVAQAVKDAAAATLIAS